MNEPMTVKNQIPATLLETIEVVLAVGGLYPSAEATLKACAREIEKLQSQIGIIRCPDSVGGFHRWNGDGQCLDCCNYATDLSDAALENKDG